MDRFQELSRALEGNLGMTLRAERFDRQLDLFVEAVNPSELLTNNNQVVWGRRGAGKTILLKALKEMVDQDYGRSGIYGLYYTATDFRSSPDGTAESSVSDRVLAHRFFYSFIQQLVDDVLGIAAMLMPPAAGINRATEGSAERRRKRLELDTLGLRLLTASGYGTDVVGLESTSRTTEQTTRSLNKKQAALGVSTSTSLGIGASGGRGNEQESVSKITSETRSLKHFEPHLVRGALAKMLETLDIHYLIIFIDEWMTLGQAQVEFAERLKQCFFGESRIAIKIAADRYQGRFNNSEGGIGLRGIQVNSDIFEAADLDAPFREPGSQELLALALYRRLVRATELEPNLESPLEDIFGPRDDPNTDYFIRSLFANKHAFEELCYSSQGLCRKFFDLFETSSKKIGLEVTKSTRIDKAAIQTANIVNSQTIYKEIEGRRDLGEIWSLITELLDKTSSRYFLVPADVTTADGLLRELNQLRVIHGVDRRLIAPTIRSRFRAFEVDYGVALEISKIVDEYAGVVSGFEALTSQIAAITPDNAERYALDLGSIRAGDIIRCVRCRSVFSATEHVYVTKGYCPSCVEPADQLGPAYEGATSND